jgi:hypothetical protein
VPRTSDLQLHALWRDRVRRQSVSGLTITQFCAQERLSLGSFHAWKRRLRLIGLADHRPALPAPSTFLPVTVRVAEHTADPGAPGLPIEADLPNGIRLRIPTSSARLACRLIRAVARARTDSGGSR